MRRFYDVDKQMEREMPVKKISATAGSPQAEGDSHHVDIGSPVVTNNAAKGFALQQKRIAAEAAAANQFSEGFMSFCQTLAPVFSATMFVAMLIWLITVSGTSGGSEKPKVAVIVFEGFRGDIFQSAVINGNKGPFMSSLLQADISSYSTCSSVDDYKCARTQGGTALGDEFTFGAAPGLASILTGVNAQRHMISNDSALANYATTSKAYPSIAKHLKSLGLTTAAVGTSKLISTITGDDCLAHGLLDYECGTDVAYRCYETSDCNVNARVPTAISSTAGAEETHMLEGFETALVSNPDFLIFHTSKLARGAEDPARNLFSYDAKSPEYLAEVFLLDAIVGQIASELKERSKRYRENWLLIGTSTNGGYGKSTSHAMSGYDEAIPFFIVPLAANAIKLKALSTPASQMDIFPTVLKWLNVAGPTNMTFDGQAQGICTNGIDLLNCTA